MINARNCEKIVTDYKPKQKLPKYALKKIPLKFQGLLTTLAGNELSCISLMSFDNFKKGNHKLVIEESNNHNP